MKDLVHDQQVDIIIDALLDVKWILAKVKTEPTGTLKDIKTIYHLHLEGSSPWQFECMDEIDVIGADSKILKVIPCTTTEVSQFHICEKCFKLIEDNPRKYNMEASLKDHKFMYTVTIK
jgi:hypothetical protein